MEITLKLEGNFYRDYRPNLVSHSRIQGDDATLHLIPDLTSHDLIVAMAKLALTGLPNELKVVSLLTNILWISEIFKLIMPNRCALNKQKSFNLCR